jgi:hypothetical protein
MFGRRRQSKGGDAIDFEEGKKVMACLLVQRERWNHFGIRIALKLVQYAALITSRRCGTPRRVFPSP